MTTLPPTGISVAIRTPLEEFDLDVEFSSRKRTIGVFGTSGSGKTTLIESISGIRRNVTGQLLFDGATWLDTEKQIDLPPENRSVGFIPQDQRLFPHLSVRKNLSFGHRNKSPSRKVDAVSSFQEIVELLDLDSLLDRSVTEISGGESQRVALGRALLTQPKLLLLDEPFASLDVALRNRVVHYLTKIREQLNLPMFLVSHDPLEVQLLCDEVIHLEQGKITQKGTPEVVLSDRRFFSLQPSQSFINVLPGTHIAQHASSSQVEIDGCELIITSPRIQECTGKNVSISIPAREVMIAKQRVEGISARNVMEATICRIEHYEEGCVIFSSLKNASDHQLAAEVTDEAVEELSLKQGESVCLIIKTHSICTHDR
ncbi:MAG: molybdenum ABC transporter ATP-binding protein [Verrucomicrobiota bacterium]